MRILLLILLVLSIAYNGYQYTKETIVSKKIDTQNKQLLALSSELKEIDDFLGLNDETPVNNEIVAETIIADNKVTDSVIYTGDNKMPYTGNESLETMAYIMSYIESNNRNICNKIGYCGYWQFKKPAWDDAMNYGITSKYLKHKIPYKKLKNSRDEQLTAMKLYMLNNIKQMEGTVYFKDIYASHQQGASGYKNIKKMAAGKPLVSGKSKKAKKANRLAKMKTLYNMANNIPGGFQYYANTWLEVWDKYPSYLIDSYYANGNIVPKGAVSKALKQAATDTGIYKYKK